MAAPHVVSAQAKTFSWKMTNAYGPGAPFYVQGPGSPTDFIKMVDAMSQGRLKIQHFAAGELIPALEGFDAVSKGTVEMNCANAYFWAGKTFAAQYFTAVPFGFNFQGMNAWLYHGGGIKLWEEVYAPFNLVPIPMGNTGVQMTGWFKKPIEKVEDLKGLKMRIPGLAGRVYAAARRRREAAAGGRDLPGAGARRHRRGRVRRPLSGPPARPAQGGQVLHTTGWHESSTVTELIVNKAAWDSLPPDLQEIVRTAAGACQAISQSWCDATNTEALEDLIANQGVKAAPLPIEILAKLKEVTVQTLNDNAAKDPLVKKVHDSYMGFKKGWDKWAAISEGVYHSQIRGQI